MKRKRYTENQIIEALKAAEAGGQIKDICRNMGIAESTFFRWQSKYSGMELSDLKRLKELEQENQRLKRIVADLTLDNQILKEVCSKNWKSPQTGRK